MSESFIVVAEARADEGKGASRRLRRLEGKMPAVIYGGGKPAQSLTLIRKDFEHMLENEACFSSILEVQGWKARRKMPLSRTSSGTPPRGSRCTPIS